MEPSMKWRVLETEPGSTEQDMERNTQTETTTTGTKAAAGDIQQLRVKSSSRTRSRE